MISGRKNLPLFPVVRGEWSSLLAKAIDVTFRQLRDYLSEQPVMYSVDIEYALGSTPTKALSVGSKPIGIVPLALYSVTESGLVTHTPPAPFSWSISGNIVSIPSLLETGIGTKMVRVLIVEVR